MCKIKLTRAILFCSALSKAPAKKKKKAAISFDDLLSDDDDDVDDNDDDDDDDDEIAETKRKPNPSRGARASGTKMTSIMKACMSFDSDDEDSDSDIDAWSAGGSSSGNGIGKKMAGGKRSRSNTPEPVAEPVVVAAVPATTTAISVSAAIGAAAAAIGGAAAAAAAAAAAGLTAAGKTMTNKRSRSNTPEPVVIPPTPTPATPPTKTATTAKSPFQVGDVVFVNKTTHDRHTAKVLERPEEGGTVKVRWELRGGEEVVDVGKCEILNLTEGERAKRASLDEDENIRDESREMATDIMATSTTKLKNIIPLNSFDSLVLLWRRKDKEEKGKHL